MKMEKEKGTDWVREVGVKMCTNNNNTHTHTANQIDGSEENKFNIFQNVHTLFRSFVRSLARWLARSLVMPFIPIQNRNIDTRIRTRTYAPACKQIPFIQPLGDTNLIEKL